MIQTTGKKNPEKEAHKIKQDEKQKHLDKRTKKKFDKLSPKEKADALDAMLEWWLAQ